MRFRKLIIYILTLFVISVGFFKSQSQSDFYISDGQGNQNPVINQSGSKVLYFNTEAQAIANVSGTDIKSLAVTSSQIVYARITISTCLLIIPVTFTLV